MRLRSFLASAGLLLGALNINPALADNAAPTRVGRLSLVDGKVGFRPAGGEWSDGTVNLPVAAGMVLRTDTQARAEFYLGDRRVVLAPDTELDLATIDEHTTELAVRRGRIGIELRRLGADETVQLDLPGGGVWLAKPGHYEVVAASGGAPARVAAFDGAARFAGDCGDLTIGPNHTAVLNGKPAGPSFEETVADAFSGWWRAAGAGAGNRILPANLHMSPEMTGIEALDGSGHWQAVSGYGPVWFADGLPDNWTPYRDGAWRWIQPWGWTWVDDKPWGFATSHYGRWARIAAGLGGSERWGWVPGAAVDQPAYAPALVGFIGTAGVGISYPDGFGPALAWYALAPGEVYRPGFTHDLAAIRKLNAGSVADPGAISPEDADARGEIVGGRGQNRRFANAVPRSVFIAGKPVPPALVEIPAHRLQEAPLILASMQFPPQPAPQSQNVARNASPLTAQVLAAAAVRLAAASARVTKPAAARNLPALARALMATSAKAAVRAPVAAARAHARAVAARPIMRPPFLIAVQRLAEARRQHLAAARSPGH